jgi:hypothetical protein
MESSETQKSVYSGSEEKHKVLMLRSPTWVTAVAIPFSKKYHLDEAHSVERDRLHISYCWEKKEITTPSWKMCEIWNYSLLQCYPSQLFNFHIIFYQNCISVIIAKENNRGVFNYMNNFKNKNKDLKQIWQNVNFGKLIGKFTYHRYTWEDC